MRARRSGSSLFLLELIIAMLFFSLSCTVCVRLFVKASALSSETVSLNKSVLLAQEKAEEFSAGTLTENEEIYFDKNWNLLDSSDGAASVCTVTISPENDHDLTCSILISRTADHGEIYRLSVMRHERRTGA